MSCRRVEQWFRWGLLFSTDYPHWQFDGDAVLPEGLSSELARKTMIDNPRATDSRLPSEVQRCRAGGS